MTRVGQARMERGIERKMEAQRKGGAHKKRLLHGGGAQSKKNDERKTAPGETDAPGGDQAVLLASLDRERLRQDRRQLFALLRRSDGGWLHGGGRGGGHEGGWLHRRGAQG